MSNSALVNCTVLSPNHSGKRTHSIDRITPHCVVGQLSAERIGACFPSGRGASCNYGVGFDGRVCLIVDEANRSWCSSSSSNDQRAVTIEVASDSTSPYAFTNEAYNKLVELCVDICKRNGKTKILWFNDENKSLSYNPSEDEMVLTVHRWFSNKECPGDWMYNKMGTFANDVNKLISNGEAGDVENNEPSDGENLYRVQCGAFSVKSNADAMMKDIESKNIDAFIVKVDVLYKVQVGAYSVKSNADKQLNKMKDLGYDCFITSVSIESESFIPRKSTDEIAQEILNGICSDSRWSTWGTGTTRVERLTLAGYNADDIQKEVNKLF